MYLVSSWLSWLERRFRACVVLNFTGSLTNNIFISEFHLVLYNFPPLFCILVLRTSRWPLEFGRIR